MKSRTIPTSECALLARHGALEKEGLARTQRILIIGTIGCAQTRIPLVSLLEVFELIEHSTIRVGLLERFPLLPPLPERLEVFEPLCEIRLHRRELRERDRRAEGDVCEGWFVASEYPLSSITEVFVEPETRERTMQGEPRGSTGENSSERKRKRTWLHQRSLPFDSDDPTLRSS